MHALQPERVHTSAAAAISGLSVLTLQQILGHASIKTTEGHLDYLTPDEKRGAMHGLGGFARVK